MYTNFWAIIPTNSIMNLYFRLILILIKSRFADKKEALDESRHSFRVWPLDCDMNMHMTNSRYFALCDLSRTYFMGQLGVLYKMIKKNWLPVAQAQEINYFKAIDPFQKFEVSTRLTYWDDKYWYIEHRFLVGDNVCALLQVRGLFVQGKKVIPMQKVLDLLDEKVKSPDKPALVNAWQALIDSKKKQTE